jgi:tetratricopeptide (TPR) repeat protein
MDEKLFMVFCQSLNHKITKSFWGPKFTMHQAARLSHILSYYWGDKGNLPSGMHVGHLSFCLARVMGCNPIILVGMDLAFAGDKFHAEDIETKVPITPLEEFSSEGIFGEMLKSDLTFRNFVIGLNEEIKSTDALCIDATEGGAKKEGTKIMRLRDVIEEYCQDKHPEIRRGLEEESSKLDPVKYDELIKDFKFAEEESKEMKKASESTLKTIKKLRKMKENGLEGNPEYIKLSQKAEKLTARAGGKGRIMSMLENYNFANILFMEKNDVRRIDELEDEFEKLDRQMERAETYYKNFIKALNPFTQDIQRLLRRLSEDRKAQEILEKSPKKWSDYLKYGLKLIKIENYTDAEAAFKKVIEQKPDYSDAYYYLGTIYSEQNRFKTAIPVLKQAITLKSNFTKARELLKKCQKRNQQWQERCERIREKFSKDPSEDKDEKEIILEAGNFYFRVKDYKQAEKEYLKAIDQYPTLPEVFYHLGHTYFAMKDFDKGVEALSKALELAPGNPVIYRDLGLISINRGLVESAERFFLKAIELKPDDLELKEILGNIYLNNSMFDKAITIYEEILKSNPNRLEATKNLSLAYQAVIKSDAIS